MSEQSIPQSSPIWGDDETIGLHAGFLAVLGTCHRLGSDEARYLMTAFAHYNTVCGWVTVTLDAETPPPLRTWAEWMRLNSRQHVCNIRTALHRLGVIEFVNGHPSHVRINTAWETWDTTLFQPYPKHPNSGSKPSGRPSTTLLRLPQHQWNKLRAIVFRRDDYTCVYCGEQDCPLECDHVVPLARGGTNDLDNLATACNRCNASKRTKLLEEWRP